jgi:hypothetical protein
MKIKIGIQNLLPEQKNSVPPGKDVIDVATAADDELGVVPAKKSKEQKYKDAYPDPLKDFKSTGANRGQLQISLEFLDDVTYERLSKAAREGDINKFTRIVRNAEKNAFKKKKQLIGVIAALDAATVPLGIKWYKDIAIGFMAGYAQMDAEAALQAFVDSDMNMVLMGLYPLFRLKQPQNKTEAVKIIKEEDPSLLLPMKYQAPEGPGFFDLFGNYDKYFEVEEGTWSEPLYEAFQRAYSSIDNILKIYSHPPLSTTPRGFKAGRKLALEGFTQFLDDVAIYQQYNDNSDEGLKRSRAEIFKAIQHSIGLSKAIIDAGKYLQEVDKYKDDPKMIIGAYQSYNKADPYEIPGRVDIIAPFLDELIKRNLDYPEQAAATNKMIQINDKYFKPLARRDAADELDRMVKELRINEEIRMKKIRVVFDDIKNLGNKKQTLVSEGRFNLDDILSLRLPTLNFRELGTELVSIGRKRIPLSPSAKATAKQGQVISALDKLVSNAKGGEGLETLAKKAMKQSADDGEPVIVTVKYMGKGKEGEVVDASGMVQRELHVLVGPDGLIAVTRTAGDADTIARRYQRSGSRAQPDADAPGPAPRPRDPSDSASAWGDQVVKPFENMADAAAAPGQLKALEKIAKAGGGAVGSLKNPFPTIESAQRYYEGKSGFFGTWKGSSQFGKRITTTFEDTDAWVPARTGKNSTSYVYVGAPSKPSNVIGFQKGKVKALVDTKLGIDLDGFLKSNFRTPVETIAKQGEELMLGPGIRFSTWKGKQVWATGAFPRFTKFWKSIYVPSDPGLMKAFDVTRAALDVYTGSAAVKFALEPLALLISKEFAFVSSAKIVTFARWYFLARSLAAGGMILAYAADKARDLTNYFSGGDLKLKYLEIRLSVTEDEKDREKIRSQIAKLEKDYIERSKRFARDQVGAGAAAKIKDMASARKSNEEIASDFEEMGDQAKEILDFINGSNFGGKSIHDYLAGLWDDNDRSIGPVDSGIPEDSLSALIPAAAEKIDDKFKPKESKPFGPFDLADPLTPEKRKEYLDAEQEFDDFRASGLSERDFTEWKATVSPADYVRWRKSKQTVDQWLDDEIDEKIYNEHNDLGAALENYFGNNIIKNIKIGSKTGPRSGDKK